MAILHFRWGSHRLFLHRCPQALFHAHGVEPALFGGRPGERRLAGVFALRSLSVAVPATMPLAMLILVTLRGIGAQLPQPKPASLEQKCTAAVV